MWHSRPPRDPPPFMANTILNFHFDDPHLSLSWSVWQSIGGSSIFGVDINYGRGKTIDWPSTVSQGGDF